jgi:hypothetical protein
VSVKKLPVLFQTIVYCVVFRPMASISATVDVLSAAGSVTGTGTGGSARS